MLSLKARNLHYYPLGPIHDRLIIGYAVSDSYLCFSFEHWNKPTYRLNAEANVLKYFS